MAVLALVLAAALDVPFVEQREETCGPASLAMVLSYWGDDVTHDELAKAAAEEPGGVYGSSLAALASQRGHRAVAFEGDLGLLRDYLGRGWPLVVALDAGKGRFHDVVVVGIGKDDVLVHDPARGPGRRMGVSAFVRRWNRSGRWTLLVLPKEER
jgi:ABC-type bacteriocin/lantibiotic exporter with double-glycine peptidase domain